jgi:hypothetical protein
VSRKFFVDHGSVVEVIFLPDRCPATISRIRGYADRWEEFMKYVVEMVSVAMIYIPSIVVIGS